MRRIADLKTDERYFIQEMTDLIVVGAGHAGCEAAVAAAKLGQKVTLFTLSLDQVANLPCNPNIGGSAKGQLVREIAALGGVMPEIADKSGIQFRMLNVSKGPAVWAPRAQMDRRRYQMAMKTLLETTEGLTLRQAEIVELLGYCETTDEGEFKVKRIEGVLSRTNVVYPCKALILTTGTYLDSRVIVGEVSYESGPDQQFPSKGLAVSLKEWGIPLRRFKTGTPVRVNRRSLNLDKMEIQAGDPHQWTFDFHYPSTEPRSEDLEATASKGMERLVDLPCYVTWTNERTHEIIRRNVQRSPLFSGEIKGIGPRYCPSIEDKVLKFPDKERHQIFVEPTGIDTEEMYVQGLSSSMPEEVQMQFLHTVEGLENAVIQRIGYAIEYECIDSLCLNAQLKVMAIDNLYCAGQINGTSGYEEAAGQGLIAGINAARALRGEEAILLDRSQAYIGVLIDDLVTVGTNEPYRMMSSRAEYRLLLRQDNADERLSEIGYRIGLLTDRKFQAYQNYEKAWKEEVRRLRTTRVTPGDIVNEFLRSKGSSPIQNGTSLAELLKRPEISYSDLVALNSEIQADFTSLGQAVENEIKYEGYIRMEERRIAKFKQMESRLLPEHIDYSQISGLRLEARQKLNQIKPQSLGQAGRISGVSPADIQVLLVYLEAMRRA